MQEPHILVVDDDPEIRDLLVTYLRGQGFRASFAGDRASFSARIAAERFDLVVLDVMLPDGSGLDICRGLRLDRPNLPVILLTALREDIDRIIGLEIGADDYMGKPFNPRELVARIRAVLRRAQAVSLPGSETEGHYRFVGFTLDPGRYVLLAPDGEPVELTPAEFALLEVFVRHAGRLLSRDQLLDATQGREHQPFDRSIDILMSRLRRKLGEHSPDTLFRTVRNGGYQLVCRVEFRSEEA
ncbi:response regulator [Pararhizobium mangrovi]|uniref:Response regulator n=1 Tax=Pararhizobium mangrovi TaxID=2590452 RepID=A0A506U531_9HYPH|nr:response regulator [Pararhizobium mangrovi]TPW28960.1 response regulator [Pararhizobium mangrovi]